jgi:hypothetical protein
MELAVVLGTRLRQADEKRVPGSPAGNNSTMVLRIIPALQLRRTKKQATFV